MISTDIDIRSTDILINTEDVPQSYACGFIQSYALKTLSLWVTCYYVVKTSGILKYSCVCKTEETFLQDSLPVMVNGS